MNKKKKTDKILTRQHCKNCAKRGTENCPLPSKGNGENSGVTWCNQWKRGKNE